MPKTEIRRLKALYFDMRIKDLEKYYSAKNPKNAYKRIKRFMNAHGFVHEQYSGYHSSSRMTDLEIFDLIYLMSNTYPWLKHCMNRFEVTNIGANHDLMGHLLESASMIS